MTSKQKIKASKFLSLLLRHRPEVAGVTLDANGWAEVPDLVRGMREHGHLVTPTILREIIAEDAKGRYASDAYGTRLRANQGHSLVIDLGLEKLAPPTHLFHGTAQKTLWMIYRDGLLPMARQHVHLSEDVTTATRVGKRHGEPVVLMIQAAQMADDGHEFYRSANGVWLTIHVPVSYLVLCVDECYSGSEATRVAMMRE